MQKNSTAGIRNPILLSLVILGLMAALVIIPSQFRSGAVSKTRKGLVQRTVSQEEGIDNYDIREDKAAADKIIGYRQSQGKDAVAVADIRTEFVRGEAALRQRIPDVKIEYNNDIRIPEVISPNVWRGQIEMLTNPSTGKRSDLLRSFVRENNSLIGVTDGQADELVVTQDYTNPDGNLSFAALEQRINNVPVFRGEVKAGFTKDGRIIRVINNLAPGVDYASAPTDFHDSLDAVKAATGYIKYDESRLNLTRNAAASTDLKVVYGEGDWATTAEKMYFPTEPGVVRAAWRVLIWEPVRAYYVIVDAEDGTMLWRKNLSEDQTQAATYNVYSGTQNLGFAMNSPAPASPGPIDPTTNFQAALGARTSVTLIGNEAAQGLTFNNNGWITDGTNGTDGWTDGNAVEAGLDIDGTNGVDATGKANGTARVFNFSYVPGNVTGGVDGGDAVTGAAYRNGIVTNLFYLNNRYHDALYKVGFTEQARNFQASNFGRGGSEADRVSAEAQDSSGTNNANFATPADGSRGRMQMYVFTGPAPQRDGDLDADVVWHEHTHGLSNRLVGNGSGLTTNRAGSSGEGWSDLYAFLLASKTTDPVNGVYSTGGYVTYRFSGLSSFTTNYYHGIRRFPYAPLAFTGGPNNRPHNPLTLADIQTVSATDGAYPCSALIGCTGSATEVHNAGEVWAAFGVEVWARMVTRLGHDAGTLRTMQVYTDGMKLSPLNPTFIQSRDSVIAAAAALPLAPEASADVADVREGFRIRGAGFSATDTGSAVVEAFDTPNVAVTDPFSVSDSTGDNDGFPEPGENVLLSVAVRNPNTGAAITNVQVNVNGGPNVSYGTVADGATVTNQIPFTVPAGTACGALQSVTINVTSSAGAQVPSTKSFRVGVPVGGAPVTFSNTAAITVNDNTTASPYPSNITVSGLTGNKTVKIKMTGMSHTFPGDLDILVGGPTAAQNLEIMSDQGGTNDLVNVDLTFSDSAAAALPAVITTGEYKPTADTTVETFPAPAPAPANVPAPGGSATMASAFGTTGSALNGTWSLYVVDDAGIDTGNIAGGWSITFEANDYACSLQSVKSRADYDGDGKTDVSLFRPGTGDWFVQRSTDGLTIPNWGLGTDITTPGDFDGDGKADEAVFRPSNGTWYVLQSSNATPSITAFGASGDVPVAGDYDGDGKADLAYFRPSTNSWVVRNSNGGSVTTTPFGATGDVPVRGDYDGDGKTDIAVFRPTTNEWWIRNSNGGSVTVTTFGATNDKPVPADYDGDNKDDIATFRPSTGQWWIRNSNGGSVSVINFGASGDVAVPGDYDGDGKDDAAVFRTGTWWINKSTGGVTTVSFGVTTDIPTPTRYIP
ncbi:MAG: M36 family metallopeptidase [Acidobacteria bacterium]|nr:M36 family metallopeptidase [Acidobacteriota bacterium]